MSVHLGDWAFRYASFMLFESNIIAYCAIRSSQTRDNKIRVLFFTRKTYWYIMYADNAEYVLLTFTYAQIFPTWFLSLPY